MEHLLALLPAEARPYVMDERAPYFAAALFGVMLIALLGGGDGGGLGEFGLPALKALGAVGVVLFAARYGFSRMAPVIGDRAGPPNPMGAMARPGGFRLIPCGMACIDFYG